jgi:hypothetical protein
MIATSRQAFTFVGQLIFLKQNVSKVTLPTE